MIESRRRNHPPLNKAPKILVSTRAIYINFTPSKGLHLVNLNAYQQLNLTMKTVLTLVSQLGKPYMAIEFGKRFTKACPVTDSYESCLSREVIAILLCIV